MNTDKDIEAAEAVHSEQSSVGHRLRAVREKRGLSLRALAEKVGEGIHFTTLGKLESGKTKLSFEWIERLAVALEVAPLEIIDEAYSQGGARTVPLYPVEALDELDEPEQTHRLGYVPTSIGGGSSYAVSVILDLDSASAESRGYLVIDPLQRAAAAGLIQVIRIPGETLFIGRFSKNELVYSRWLGFGDRAALTVGETAFRVLGTVIFVAYYP